MVRYVDSRKMGRGSHGWLESHFHFSFAEYYNPANMRFGVLRVINDDRVRPGTGFDTHPHANMEIISYVVRGELTHADSMGNKRTLTRGQVQYMSAGTGVTHSEYNLGEEELRFLQIWILPDEQGVAPNYGDVRFNFADREGRWLHLASNLNDASSPAPIKIHADINAFAAALSPGQPLEFEVRTGRQAYLVLIEGRAEINGQMLGARDALEIGEETIQIQPAEASHLLLMEMANSWPRA